MLTDALFQNTEAVGPSGPWFPAEAMSSSPGKSKSKAKVHGISPSCSPTSDYLRLGISCVFHFVILNRPLFCQLFASAAFTSKERHRSTFYDSLRSTAAWIERDLILRLGKSQNNETSLPSSVLLQARRNCVREERLVPQSWGYVLFFFFPPLGQRVATYWA